jgi:hypothetical protein
MNDLAATIINEEITNKGIMTIVVCAAMLVIFASSAVYVDSTPYSAEKSASIAVAQVAKQGEQK